MHCVRLSAAAILLIVRSGLALDRPPTIEITPEIIAVVKGNNEFATELYSVLASDKDTNLFFSPYSISTAMAMTYAGAAGTTKSQMADVLHFPQEESELHSAIGDLRKMLASSGKKSGFQLRIVNRLWGEKNYQFLPRFMKIAKTEYGADPASLNFRQTQNALMLINSWIEKQTDGKIQNMVGPEVIANDTRLLLTNAVYFKAVWEKKFKGSFTSDRPFHVSETQQVTVPILNQSENFSYGVTDKLQILELPYSPESAHSMIILLPKSKDGLHDIEKQLSGERLQQWVGGMKRRMVRVYLPKFKMTSDLSLTEVLKSMKMPLVFSERADFSRMAKQERLFISTVIHKAFVDVDEEGTEASATSVTGLGLGLRVQPEVPVEFRADHPFIFLIRHNRTNSILFLGRVINPTDAENETEDSEHE